jgi:hypothetical protein
VALAVAIDVLIRRAAGAVDQAARMATLRYLRLSAEAETGLGAPVVLLTAAAQVAG